MTISLNQSSAPIASLYSLFIQNSTTQSKLCLHNFFRAFLHTIKDDFYNEGGTPYIGKISEKKEEKMGATQSTLTW